MIERSTLQPSSRAMVLFAGGLVLAILPVVTSAALWPLWLAFCGLVVLACGVDAVLCPRAGELAVEPAVPARLPMATVAEATLELALPVPWPVAAEATLDLSPILEPIGLLRLRLSATPAAIALPLRPRRRGRARIEALWVRYNGPLGLMRRTVCRRLDLRLEAVPDVALVHAAALAWSTREAMAGMKIERYAGDGTDFHALREFVTGDDPRSIDWKTSARHLRLLSREFRAERNHQIVLALDTGRLMAEPIDGAPLVDHAIHAALLLAYVSLRHGDRVSLFAFDEKPHTFAPPRGGLRSMPALVAITSRLAYSSAETNFTLGLTELGTRLHRRSLIIVLTDFVDTVTAELMVENLLRLRRRHLVLFAALRDPVIEDRVVLEPRSLLDLNRAVVADALAREREVVIKRLGKEGITVIDTPPRRLGTALINRYLEIKRREKI